MKIRTENDVADTCGIGSMSDNEMELLNIIRKSEDPAKALAVAVQIIATYLAAERRSLSGSKILRK